MARKRKENKAQEAIKSTENKAVDLARKYRPASIEDFYGNTTLKKSLKNSKIPNQALFYGDSGSGKTTLARIFANQLECSEFDLKEIDTGDFRGIDTVREIRRIMGKKPMKGPVRVFIIDECFAPNTPITMKNGNQKNIKDIKPFDEIKNLNGIDIVKGQSKNKVDLNRLVKVSFSNGSILYTTKDHVFFTERGEVEAKNITKNDLILSKDPQFNKTKTIGQKEGNQIGRTKLESIAFYESRSDRKHFNCIVGDKEREQGFVEFYDLEIENHPSYFAANIAVHNCHMLGRGGDSSKNEAQNALLKALEEPPKNCYFFLCTTDPQNLIAPIKSRCVQYKVQALSEKQTFNFVTDIAKKEEVDLPKKVGLQIARDSLGHPRDALKILEKILYMEEDDMLEAAKQEAEKREQSITLCRALMSRKSWKDIAEILKGIDEEPETTRRIIRGYFASVLMNGNSEAFIVLDCLKQPFYNIDGKNELIRCLYEIHSEFND